MQPHIIQLELDPERVSDAQLSALAEGIRKLQLSMGAQGQVMHIEHGDPDAPDILPGQDIREFELFVKGLPGNHSARHVAGILRQALANLGIDTEVEAHET